MHPIRFGNVQPFLKFDSLGQLSFGNPGNIGRCLDLEIYKAGTD
jgi:hypothetical protein